MEKTIFSLKSGLFAGFMLLFTVALTNSGISQNPFPCPPQNGVRTTNPDFPGCKAPGGSPFKVLLVLDESGSIASANATNTVKNAVKGFANLLNSGTSSTGQIQMGIVEFASSSSYVYHLKDVKDGNFISTLNNYVNSQYSPGGGTDYESALNTAESVVNSEGVEILFFITDGNPSSSANSWRPIANRIKCKGTYIFGIGVGAENATMNMNIQTLSGPDLLNPPAVTLQNGADWTRQSFSNLGPLLIDLANSLIDTKAPELTCSGPIMVNNTPKECFATVTYTTTVSDNCPDVALTCTPPSGNFFIVGQTTVTCTATDKVGTSTTCTFRVTVSDMEAPEIICPSNLTVSCEVALEPATTGEPTVMDNCAIDEVTKNDVRTDGICPNTFTVNRAWTAVDVHSNVNTCMQVIQVEDKKVPVITCPVNITVACDTSAAKTGLATATDNCTVRPTFTRSDVHISGDCDWLCVTERTWVAMDECQNTSKCVQKITKDVTPLVAQALGTTPLVLGQDQATVTVSAGDAACLVQWMPYSGTIAKELKFDDAVPGVNCMLATNPLDDAGHIVNPLLGEVMRLSILARLNPAFGTRKLSSFPCTIHFIIKQALKPDPDVNELLRVANLTLGNINFGTAEHKKLLLEALQCIGGGVTICNVNQ